MFLFSLIIATTDLKLYLQVAEQTDSTILPLAQDKHVSHLNLIMLTVAQPPAGSRTRDGAPLGKGLKPPDFFLICVIFEGF